MFEARITARSFGTRGGDSTWYRGEVGGGLKEFAISARSAQRRLFSSVDNLSNYGTTKITSVFVTVYFSVK